MLTKSTTVTKLLMKSCFCLKLRVQLLQPDPRGKRISIKLNIINHTLTVSISIGSGTLLMECLEMLPLLFASNPHIGR